MLDKGQASSEEESILISDRMQCKDYGRKRSVNTKKILVISLKRLVVETN
jgi:hypothetical protein